ncbi:MAG TPA: LPS export ABC transporter periplasmic protein LptC [Vicinamibacterales bacterium]|nr:LPS export ABC transporter periplasmic protein LptC [Vicinamibacterales bacterium]
MTLWQRRARLVIGVSAIAFGLFVAFAFKRRAEGPAPPPSVQSVDPGAVVVALGGNTQAFQLSRETVSVAFKQQSLYSNGSMKLLGVTINAEEKNGDSHFKATGNEATSTKDFTSIVLTGNVQLESTDIRARTEHATYTKSDNTVRAPGPIEITEGKTTASGVGMTFDREHDVMTIADRAVVRMAAEQSGGASTEIACATAVFDRRQHFRRFEHNVRMQRGGQITEADTATAFLNTDNSRIESIELRGGSRIAMDNPAVGALQSLVGRDVTLKYAAAGQAIEHATLAGQTKVVVAGAAGHPGRQISAESMDVALAADGTTPTSVIAHERVELMLPAEGTDTPLRTIQAPALDAKGQPGRGLTRALFSGNVQYREKSAKAERAANAGTLEVGLKPGLSEIEDARFSHAVHFEEGALSAIAAAARYDPEKGTLALSGSEAGAAVPRVLNQQIAIDAAAIDVTLEGPKVQAKGTVKSLLQPAKKGSQGDNGVKMPSMLKQDLPVNVTADALDYDGTRSLATYSGDARLFQADTSFKAETIVVDDKLGDLSASGGVTSTTMLQQSDKDKKNNGKSRSTATSKEMKYEDEIRRLTYTDNAHLVGPDGDMSAARIELYLKPSGDELERAEAYENLTLREQSRETTGAKLIYTTENETYVITGTPVKIVDQCQRETVGRTLTFNKGADSIVVDGNSQIRTQTKGGNGKCTS